MCTFVKELSNCYESFLRLSEFSDVTHKMKFSIRKNFHNNKETIKNNNKERISSVNVTKSAGNCGFSNIY